VVIHASITFAYPVSLAAEKLQKISSVSRAYHQLSIIIDKNVNVKLNSIWIKKAGKYSTLRKDLPTKFQSRNGLI